MSEDTISRQAAIDGKISIQRTNGLEMYSDEAVPVEYLKALPSAQPEIIRCKDCKHGIDYYHDGDCYCSNPKWEVTYFGGSWEFYCADAERREE